MSTTRAGSSKTRTRCPGPGSSHEAVKTKTGQILPQFVDGSVDPRRIALIDSEVPALDAAVSGPAETVEIVHRGNDEIRLRVNAASRGMVILSEIWDPGWTATVDGNETKIYRADFMFRGVVVDAGEHEIVLRYPATKVKQTLLFYLIPLIAFGLLGIVALRDRRRWELSPPESWDRPEPNGEEIEPPPDS